jgi:hypothetical protein
MEPNLPDGSVKDKVIAIPINLAGGGMFLLLGAVLLFVTPGQVKVAARDVVNGRVFPSLATILMMICGSVLAGKDLVFLALKKPIAIRKLSLRTEIKALAIMGVLLGTFLLCRLTGLFVAGACFCCLGILLFFRCKKIHYYAITLAGAVLIWACFRFILGVRF